MRFIAAVVAFAAAATAAPEFRSYPPMDQITVSQANDVCGSNLELSCCNKETNQAAGKGDQSKNPGVVGGILDGLSLLDECSQLDIAALIGIEDLLKTKCQQKAACCQRSPANAAGGLINLALPCIALNSLIQ